jgi:predicted Zn-dependent protease
MHQNRLQEAEHEARIAIGLDPTLLDARLSLVSILSRSNRYDEAAELLDRLRPEFPDNPEIHARLGVALEASGRPGEALPLLREAIDVFPKNRSVLRALARAEEAAGDRRAAQRAFAALAQHSPPGETRDEATEALERLALEAGGPTITP